jgi:hypothetical protein
MAVTPEREPWMDHLSPRMRSLMASYLEREFMQIAHKALGGPLFSTLQQAIGGNPAHLDGQTQEGTDGGA